MKEIWNFSGAYARTTKFNRALKRRYNGAKFTQLGANLTEGMQALQLDVAVDSWAKEDESDRLEELENMMDMLERMEERNRTDIQAEIMGVLKVSMEVLQSCGMHATWGICVPFSKTPHTCSAAFACCPVSS